MCAFASKLDSDSHHAGHRFASKLDTDSHSTWTLFAHDANGCPDSCECAFMMVRFFLFCTVICFIFAGFEQGMIALSGTTVLWLLWSAFTE